MNFLRSANKETEDIEVSPDYSRLYVGHNNGTTDLTKFWYELKILDTELNEVYTDQIELENNEALNTMDFKFNANGDAAIVARRVKDSEDREKGKPNVFYTAAVLRNGEVTRYQLELGGYHTSDIQLTFAPDNGLILAGFYSTKSENAANGIFMVREDIEVQGLMDIKHYEFTVDEITRFSSEKSEKRANKKEETGKEVEFRNYDIRNIEVNDEAIFIVSEQFHITVLSSYSASGSSNTTYHYNFMDVMVIKLDFEGNVLWISRVPKYNYTSTSSSPYGFEAMFNRLGSAFSNPWGGYNGINTLHLDQEAINNASPFSSYNYTTKDGNIYILYNDHLKNHTEYNPKKIVKSKKGGDNAVTCLARIDNEGNLSRKY
ncbi:MAG: hypothetical protein CL840_06245 [Crocinitomicaceae bacterium]|nr:hypothetical protein [Crocinitomicaceae bacterium]|tara:strand:- start:7305 stop:8429 length:1125 start_codon:yes stop_codon:yes gene_type:complete